MNGLQNENSVIQIRYFEVACKLALVSAQICEIVEPVLQKVFEQFFDEWGNDPLSQMTIMDFIGILG
jgi:hypothetical protein